jgi:hypothetical protein
LILLFFFKLCETRFLIYSEDEETQLDAPASPSRQTAIPDEASVPETELPAEVPRVTRSAIKKVPVSRSTKRSKKSKEADVSLEVHEPSSFSDNVSDRILEDFSFLFACAYLFLFYQALMKKFVALGTECTQYWRVAKASEG